MIFRKSTPQYLKNTTPLQRIQARIAHLSALQLCILDVNDDNGVLIVFCNDAPMEKFVKLSLEKHWPGGIETYCPASLVTGSKDTGVTGPEDYENIARNSRYLN